MTRVEVVPAAAWSIAAAVGWLLLALAHPGTTYHLAPLVVVLAWPLAASARTGPIRWRQALVRVLGGCLVTGVAATVLHARGDLAGPALVGGSAVVETALVSLVGAVSGLCLARPRRRQGTPSGESDQ